MTPREMSDGIKTEGVELDEGDLTNAPTLSDEAVTTTTAHTATPPPMVFHNPSFSSRDELTQNVDNHEEDNEVESRVLLPSTSSLTTSSLHDKESDHEVRKKEKPEHLNLKEEVGKGNDGDEVNNEDEEINDDDDKEEEDDDDDEEEDDDDDDDSRDLNVITISSRHHLDFTSTDIVLDDSVMDTTTEDVPSTHLNEDGLDENNVIAQEGEAINKPMFTTKTKEISVNVREEISPQNIVLFENLDRTWTTNTSSPEKLLIHRLCFGAFGTTFHSVVSPHPSCLYSSEGSPDGQVDKRNCSKAWVPLGVVHILWKNIIFSVLKNDDIKDEDREDYLADIFNTLTLRGFLITTTSTTMDHKTNKDDDGKDATVCWVHLSPGIYQEYAEYVLRKDWMSLHPEEDCESKMHEFVGSGLFEYLSTADDASKEFSSLEHVMRNYSVMNYPLHCIKSWCFKEKASMLLCDGDYAKKRIQLMGIVGAAETHVKDSELLLEEQTKQKTMERKEDADREEQIQLLVSAYESIAKVCRESLEEVDEDDIVLEFDEDREDDTSVKALEESEEDDEGGETALRNESSTQQQNSNDQTRYAVAKSLHMLGYSLSKTFGFNVVTAAAGIDVISPVLTQQDIQYYQESLSLFSLLRSRTAEVKVSQAETLFCLGNCYAYQNYMSLPLNTASPSAPLTHLSFVKHYSSSSPMLHQAADISAPIKNASGNASSTEKTQQYRSSKVLNTKAIKCYDNSFYLRRTQLGNDHLCVADSLHAIGVLYFEVENWAHAVGCFTETLRIRRLHCGVFVEDGADEDHRQKEEVEMSVADTHEWIGHCQRELGKQHVALTHLNEALVLRRIHLGRRHPDVAALLYKVAIVHDDLGEVDLSLENYTEALHIYREYSASTGKTIEVETTLRCIGNVYKYFSEWNRALECYVESMDLMYSRLTQEIDWLEDVTQEDEEARALPIPMYHNRDGRDGGGAGGSGGRVLVISTSLDPAASASLLRQRKPEDVDKLSRYVDVVDEVYNLQYNLNRGKHDKVARILYRKAKALTKLGRYKDAVTTLNECRKECWLWDTSGLNTMEFSVEMRLCGMQARMGQHDLAIKGYRDLLNRCQSTTIDDNSEGNKDNNDHDTNVCDILYNLGNSHSVVGEHNEALSYLQKCLRLRTELKDKLDEIEIANTKYCLAVVYCNMGQYDASRDLLEEALVTFEEKLGPHHIHVAHVLYCLGQAHQSSLSKSNDNDPEETERNLNAAMADYERALYLFRIHYSPDHISIGHILHSIANVHDTRRDYSKAMLNFTDALRVYKLYNNGNHLGVAALMNSMGIVSACCIHQRPHNQLPQKPPYDLALSYFNEALRIRKRYLGERHPAVADTLHNIGGVYAKQSKLDESVTCYQQTLDIRTEYYGNEHLVVAKTMNNLGIVYTRQNKYGDAMGLFKAVLKIRRMHLRPEDEDIATTLYNIGNIHSRTNEFDLAMVCYEEALRVRRIVFGDNHVGVANMLHSMGTLLVDREKYNEAVACLDEALQVKRIELGDDTLSFSYTLQKIGSVREKQQDYVGALSCYNEAMNIHKRRLGQDHPNVASLLVDIGNVYRDLGDRANTDDGGDKDRSQKYYEASMECYEEALHIREAFYQGENHADVARVFFAMGSLYCRRDPPEIEGAMICFGNAARIAKKLNWGEGNNDPTGTHQQERLEISGELRKVVAMHSKKNGTAAAFWDTIVVTGDYWLGIEQVLLDLVEMLKTYVLEPATDLVRNTITEAVRRLETGSLGHHGILVGISQDGAAYNALYEGHGLCLTAE